ncbi:hypothetical protein [Aminobacter sp. DSM 101952]|nr:hypothetical protein [Aminobacter sp. DSM 101952]
MSWLEPTATIRSPEIASACAWGFAGSIVITSPLRRIRSGA